MAFSIVSFVPAHLEPAAARRAAPGRPPRSEDIAAARSVSKRRLAKPGIDGMAASGGGEPAGFLLGAPALVAPTQSFAGFRHPRAADMPYEGLAATAGDEGALSFRPISQWLRRAVDERAVWANGWT